MADRRPSKAAYLVILLIITVLLTASSSSAFFKKTPKKTPLPADIATKTIVIDPGHGGKDVGAISTKGILEKDITLGVALELEKILIEKTGLKVILTRTDDSSISLGKRAQAASEAKADLFISIHANSSKYRSVKGVETFFLSFEASDNEARLVAARENNVPEIEAEAKPKETFWEDTDQYEENPTKAEDIGNILLDMVQTESHHESSRLAELIHKNIVKATGARNRGVRQAPFRVLTGTAVPAVLLELGFLSNKGEARRLSMPKTQRAIATAITGAIVKFDRTLAIKVTKAKHARAESQPVYKSLK